MDGVAIDGAGYDGVDHINRGTGGKDLSDRGNRLVGASGGVVSPSLKLLLFEIGQRQQSSIATHRVSLVEWLLSKGPFLYGVAIEEMGGDDRDVFGSEGREVDVVGKVPDIRAFGPDHENIVVEDYRRDPVAAIEGLRVSD